MATDTYKFACNHGHTFDATGARVDTDASTGSDRTDMAGMVPEPPAGILWRVRRQHCTAEIATVRDSHFADIGVLAAWALPPGVAGYPEAGLVVLRIRDKADCPACGVPVGLLIHAPRSGFVVVYAEHNGVMRMAGAVTFEAFWDDAAFAHRIRHGDTVLAAFMPASL